MAWEPDGSGFAYTRYPDGDQYHRTVHHHVLGARWEDDPVVWAADDDPQAWPSVSISPDGAWLVVHVMVGWSQIDVHVLDRATGAWTSAIAGEQATTSFSFATDGSSLVGVTTFGASRGRVVRASLAAPQAGAWETLVAEGDAVLGGLAVRGDELLVVATSRAVDSVRRYAAADGRGRGVVDGLGDVIAIAGLTADRDTGQAFAVVDSFGAPTAVHGIAAGCRRRDAVGRRRRDSGSGAAAASCRTWSVSQLEYPSLDGTSIGLFLVHRRDVTPGPDVPCILNGYGGFAITETPVWSPQIAAWCAAGGVYAIAGLRGGYEDGEAWHLAGRRAAKQNVFDDFHAGADWLVATGLTSRDRLAVLGRSNGGLLVGVAMTQRPDLCRAVWCGVPLLDMVRFPQFLIARLWTSEYGDPDVAEEFGWLHAYSPYHHVDEPPATRPRCSRPPRATRGSTRSTPARWPPSSRSRRRAPTTDRSCCSRRTAPATASASRSPSAPTSSPTASRSSPGSSAWSAAMTVRAEWIVVGGPPEPWQRLGLTVVDGIVPLFGTGIRFDPDAEPGIVGWALSGLADVPATETPTHDRRSPHRADRPGRARARRPPQRCDRPRPRRRHHGRAGADVHGDRDGHRFAVAPRARGRRDPPGLPPPWWRRPDRRGRRAPRPPGRPRPGSGAWSSTSRTSTPPPSASARTASAPSPRRCNPAG